MVRKGKTKSKPDFCVVCGDKAIGINFGQATCMSCRAFFRRNAYREEEMKCVFTDSCKIDQITRKFCTKCRLVKCFKMGMKKEWILTEEEKQMYKDKIMRNRIRREQTEKLTKSTQKKKKPKSKSNHRKSSSSFFECSSLSSRSSSTSSSSTSSLTSSESLSTPDSFFQPNFEPDFASSSVVQQSLKETAFYPQNYPTQSYHSNVNYLEHKEDKGYFLGFVDPMMTRVISPSEETAATDDPPLPPLITPPTTADNNFDFNSLIGLNDDDDDPLNMMDDLLNYVTAEDQCPLASADDDHHHFFSSQTANLWSIVDLDTNYVQTVNFQNQIHQTTSSSSSKVDHDKDFLLTSLTSRTLENDSFQCLEDPLVESLSYQINPQETDVMFREIGFPTRELIIPEKHLIRELTSACTVLTNPYHQIRDITDRLKMKTDDILLTQHYFFRMIRMAKGLGSFCEFSTTDQALMLKQRLLEMVAIRSVLFYHSDRKAWCFLDDQSKSSVMIPMNMIQPYCRWEFKRHAKFPNLFRVEWIRDTLIFDLLTTIILFSPKDEYSNRDKMKEEHLRYTRLLSRYLEVKYPTFTEAEACFNTLLGTVEEMRLLISDVRRFYRSLPSFHKSPLFAEIFAATEKDNKDFITNV